MSIEVPRYVLKLSDHTLEEVKMRKNDGWINEDDVVVYTINNHNMDTSLLGVFAEREDWIEFIRWNNSRPRLGRTQRIHFQSWVNSGKPKAPTPSEAPSEAIVSVDTAPLIENPEIESTPVECFVPMPAAEVLSTPSASSKKRKPPRESAQDSLVESPESSFPFKGKMPKIRFTVGSRPSGGPLVIEVVQPSVPLYKELINCKRYLNSEGMRSFYKDFHMRCQVLQNVTLRQHESVPPDFLKIVRTRRNLLEMSAFDLSMWLCDLAEFCKDNGYVDNALFDLFDDACSVMRLDTTGEPVPLEIALDGVLDLRRAFGLANMPLPGVLKTLASRVLSGDNAYTKGIYAYTLIRFIRSYNMNHHRLVELNDNRGVWFRYSEKLFNPHDKFPVSELPEPAGLAAAYIEGLRKTELIKLRGEVQPVFPIPAVEFKEMARHVVENLKWPLDDRAQRKACQLVDIYRCSLAILDIVDSGHSSNREPWSHANFRLRDPTIDD